MSVQNSWKVDKKKKNIFFKVGRHKKTLEFFIVRIRYSTDIRELKNKGGRDKEIIKLLQRLGFFRFAGSEARDLFSQLSR